MEREEVGFGAAGDWQINLVLEVWLVLKAVSMIGQCMPKSLQMSAVSLSYRALRRSTTIP
eukprot:13086479-Ditylum_brightwellii.AAC.1